MRIGNRGFALLAAIVTLAIMAISLTVLAAVDLKDRQRQQWASARLHFATANSALDRFRADVGVYPGNLADLSTAITTTGKNSCNASYNSSQVGAWKGPYYSLTMPPTGLRIGIGIAELPLDRTGGGNNTKLIMTVNSVTEINAERFDAEIDKSDGRTGGIIQYSVPNNQSGLVELTYNKSVSGC